MTDKQLERIVALFPEPHRAGGRVRLEYVKKLGWEAFVDAGCKALHPDDLLCVRPDGGFDYLPRELPGVAGEE